MDIVSLIIVVAVFDVWYLFDITVRYRKWYSVIHNIFIYITSSHEP